MELVSIIIPYNQPRQWLAEAVQSIKDQDYPYIEIIHAQGDKTVATNLNLGIIRSSGEYIKYLSDDDKLAPKCISSSVAAMEGVDFIHGIAMDFNSITGAAEFYEPKITHPTLDDMLYNNEIHGATTMYRRDVLLRASLFDESLTSAEEYDLNLRLLYNGCKIGFCDTLLAFYRRHPSQKSLGIGVDQKVRQKKIEEIRNRYR